MENGSFKLPAEVVEIVDLAKRIVEKELMPLEPEFLPHPGYAFGIKETTNLRTVFGEDTLQRLMKISRDTGLWYLMVPEKHGGSDKACYPERFYQHQRLILTGLFLRYP